MGSQSPWDRCPYCRSRRIDSRPDGKFLYCKECGKEWDPFKVLEELKGKNY